MISYMTSKEEMDEYRKDENIVIDIEMTVRGEKFHQSIVVPNYADNDRVENRDEIDKSMTGMGRILGGVILGRDDLYEVNTGD